MRIESIQAMAAYGSVAQVITTQREYREFLQMLRETSERDLGITAVEFIQATQKVQSLG